MPKTKEIEVTAPAEPSDAEGIIDFARTNSLADYLERVRYKRAYEKLLSLRGKIKIDIDIDELRGRNR